MKTLISTVLLTASMAVTSQVSAASQQTGQTYDPQNNYYENYDLSSDKSGVNSSVMAISTDQSSKTPATALGLDWPYGDDEKIVLIKTSAPTIAEKAADNSTVMYGFSFPYGY